MSLVDNQSRCRCLGEEENSEDLTVSKLITARRREPEVLFTRLKRLVGPSGRFSNFPVSQKAEKPLDGLIVGGEAIFRQLPVRSGGRSTRHKPLG